MMSLEKFKPWFPKAKEKTMRKRRVNFQKNISLYSYEKLLLAGYEAVMKYKVS